MVKNSIVEPKVLIWDTEVSTSIVRGYGNKWDYKVVEELQPQRLMSYSYKWLGGGVHFKHMHQYEDEVEFVQSLADLLNEADIAVAHNGAGFDNRIANTIFLRNGIDKPSPYKTVDTLRVARRKFRFPSNSLGDLGEYLNLGSKVSVGYKDLETDFLKGDKKAIRQMKKYNNQDVLLLEKIYKKLLPYIDNHPNMGNYMREAGVCPHCGGKDLQSRGVSYRIAGEVKQWFCNSCKSWSYDRIATRDNSNPSLVGKG